MLSVSSATVASIIILSALVKSMQKMKLLLLVTVAQSLPLFLQILFYINFITLNLKKSRKMFMTVLPFIKTNQKLLKRLFPDDAT